MDFVQVLFLIVLPMLLFLFYNSKKNVRSNLPGPSGYPLVGNIFEVDLKQLHLKLYQWSKTYGDIFQIRLFNQTFVVVSSSDILRDLFSKEPNATVTSARPDTFGRKYVLSGVDVVTSSIDKEWVKRRKLMHKLLHSYGEGLQYIEKEINNKLTELTAELSESDGICCDPKEVLEDFVISVLEILLVGKSESRGSAFHRYLTELDNNLNAISSPGVDTLYYNLPFLWFLPLPTSKLYWKYKGLQNGLLSFLGMQADKDAVGIYPAMKNIIAAKEESTSWLTDTTMESMLVNVIAAAVLTTRGMLLSLIRIILALPDVQLKLQEEVDRVIGHGRQPLLRDRQEMPYCEAVVLETLRFISHVPVSMLHSASEDVVLGKFTIPKDSVIVPNLWTMHHSEKEWKNPFTFNPERFLNNEGILLPADHETRKRFMAFGYGKRSCIGEVFAKSRIFLFVSTLMQVCTVLPPGGDKPTMLDPMDMDTGIVTHPHPYKCVFKRRKSNDQ